MATAVAFATIVAVSATPVSAKVYKRFKIGAWKSASYTSNKTGAFTHCASSARYKSGVSLLFSIDYKRRWSVGFAKDSWNLKKGKKYNVRYQVDRGPIKSAVAVASTNKLVRISLPGDDQLFIRMRRGRLLKLETGKDLLKFSLTDSNRMLKALFRCVDRYRDLVVNTKRNNNNNNNGSGGDPFSDSETANDNRRKNSNGFANNNTGNKTTNKNREQKLARRRARWQGETRIRVEQMFKKSRTKIEFIDLTKRPVLEKRYDVAWFMGKFIGTLRVMPERNMKKIDRALIKSERSRCDGRTKSGSKIDVISNTDVGLRTVTCIKDDGGESVMFLSIYPRSQNSHYVLSVFSTKESMKKAKLVGEALTRIAVSQMLDADSAPIEAKTKKDEVVSY